MKTDIKKMTLTAVLIALSILIPIYFGFLRVVLPPFTATVTAHVPLFLAMLISPGMAALVGVGSMIGFALSSPIFVTARAAMHIPLGYLGGMLIQRGMPYQRVLILIAPVHAVLEALIVLPFGFDIYQALVVVGVGTLLHHTIDSVIAFGMGKLFIENKLIPSPKRVV